MRKTSSLRSAIVKLSTKTEAVHDWQRALLPLTRGKGPARRLRWACKRLGIDVHRIVELGTFRGINAKKLRWQFPAAELLLVDVWKSLTSSGKINTRTKPDDWERIYNELLGYFATGDAENGCVTKLWRLKTHDAARRYHGAADLVYIDASHDYYSVMEDIRDWWPKLRLGGLMAGHDYSTHRDKLGLVQAVRECFGDQHMFIGAKVWAAPKLSERLPCEV